MIVGILETGDVDPTLIDRHGDYPGMFRTLLHAVDGDLEFAVVKVNAGEMPGSPAEADAWLVTGSRHGVYDDLPWIGPLKDFLRESIAAGVPVVGICFGHQILAEALGGRAEKSDKGWGLGVQDYELVNRPAWLDHVPDRFSVLALHQDQVVALPAGATVLARSPHCEYAAVAYGDLDKPAAITLQPHPEFDRKYMDDLIALRAGRAIPVDLAEKGRARLHQDVHSHAWAKLIVDYLKRAVG